MLTTWFSYVQVVFIIDRDSSISADQLICFALLWIWNLRSVILKIYVCDPRGTEPKTDLKDRFIQLCSSLGSSYLWSVFSPVVWEPRQPLAQLISLIEPLEEVPKGAQLTAACLLSYFLTHWHARSVGESWGLLKPQWVSDRWTGGGSRAQVAVSGLRGCCATKNMWRVDTKQLTKWLFSQRMDMVHNIFTLHSSRFFSFFAIFGVLPSWKYWNWTVL